jgi:hypothetical protein
MRVRYGLCACVSVHFEYTGTSHDAIPVTCAKCTLNLPRPILESCPALWVARASTQPQGRLEKKNKTNNLLDARSPAGKKERRRGHTRMREIGRTHTSLWRAGNLEWRIRTDELLTHETDCLQSMLRREMIA